MISIRRALLWSILPAVLALMAIAVLAVLREVRDEIGEVFDAQLEQIARTAPGAEIPLPASGHDDDPLSDLVVAVWNGDSAQPIYRSATHVALNRMQPPGFSTLEMNGQRWRVFVRHDAHRTIQVAQPMEVRQEVSADIAGRIGLPLLILVPALVLIVLFLVKRGLQPLTRFAAELDARSPRALESVPLSALPAELLPMATAMNQLLSRLRGALDAQDVFVADATHELLTPLTALQVQVQMLERARTDERREQATQDVHRSLERCVNLARQLLTLARHSSDFAAEPFRCVELSDVVRAAIGEVLPKAHARGIDLGVPQETALEVMGNTRALQTLLSNLLDNAIKYSPLNGRVDVWLRERAGQAVVTVSDAGPGIAPADRKRVFDRFYRAPDAEAAGSGLGLAIAREIAERHGATIDCKSPGELGGMDVEVVFPGAVTSPKSTHRAHTT